MKKNIKIKILIELENKFLHIIEILKMNLNVNFDPSHSSETLARKQTICMKILYGTYSCLLKAGRETRPISGELCIEFPAAAAPSLFTLLSTKHRTAKTLTLGVKSISVPYSLFPPVNNSPCLFT